MSKPPDAYTPDTFSLACPARSLFALLAEKWTMLVLLALREHDARPKRNGELMRRVEGVSQRMLTQTLRSLEASHLVVREDRRTVPPHVEYRLSPEGLEVAALIGRVDAWVRENTSALGTGAASVTGPRALETR